MNSNAILDASLGWLILALFSVIRIRRVVLGGTFHEPRVIDYLDGATFV